jgi:hypothetical protein
MLLGQVAYKHVLMPCRVATYHRCNNRPNGTKTTLHFRGRPVLDALLGKLKKSYGLGQAEVRFIALCFWCWCCLCDLLLFLLCGCLIKECRVARPGRGTVFNICCQCVANVGCLLSFASISIDDTLCVSDVFFVVQEVLLTGCSAGGMSTYLHADYVKTQVANPALTKYSARLSVRLIVSQCQHSLLFCSIGS